MHRYRLLTTGVFSGVLSYLLYINGMEMLGAGLAFGAALFVYFYLYKRDHFKILKGLGWMAGSTISYYLAAYLAERIYIALRSSNFSFFDISLLITGLALLAAGILGSFLVSLSYRLFLFPIKIVDFVPILLTGTILSLTHLLGNPALENFIPDSGILILYTLWQGGVAFILGWQMDRTKIS